MPVRLIDPTTDFPAIVDLLNTYQSEPVSVNQFAGWYARMPPGRLIRRMVATNADGQVIGYSYADHQTWFEDQRFDIWAIVHPQWRCQGIGAALYASALQFAREQAARLLKSEVHEDDAASLRFAEKRGFLLDRHQFESTLDLENFDESAFRDLEEPVKEAGIRIYSLADLGNTVENRRKLHAVNYAAAIDIPGTNGNWIPFDEFEQAVSGAEWFRPDGQLVALDGDEWVGLCAVQLVPKTQGAYNLITGVLRSHRGRKIALALKLAAIRYARSRGARYMRTNNDSLNAAILAVNRRLGYAPLPGYTSSARNWTWPRIRWKA
jgi:GNAT superfamily N-acetyltransferase